MRFSTGLPRLDDLLGGGIRSKTLTLVYGEEKTGKTSLALRICALATRAASAAYVDCSERLHPLRLAQVMEANRADESKLYLISVDSFSKQEKIVLNIHDFKPPAPIIVFDDFTAMHRLEIIGDVKRDTPVYKRLALQVAALKEAAMRKDLAVILVGQVHAIPDRGEERAVAQRILSHWADQILRLERDPSRESGRIFLEKPPEEAPIPYKVAEAGLIPA
ncbi:MAG: hypothetical protein DRN54_00635 [Thaumarchaeota archaeon]|nr:MAG: hypothetical protein DRN54_00635 [Nitrososphaerota archaeon]